MIWIFNLKWFLLFFFFQFDRALAGKAIDINAFLKNSHCGEQIKNLTESWNSSGQWQEDFRQKHQALVIKTPTNQLGTWIVLQKTEKSHQISAQRISPNTQLQVSWSWPGCTQKLAEIALTEKNKSDEPAESEVASFDDGSLQKLIDEKKDGIIYALSPHMNLSVEAIPIIEKVAEKLNVKLTMLVDSTESKIKNKDAFILAMKSQELILRGMSMHYPCIILYSKNGKFSGVYPGRKSENEYLEFAREFLK